MPLTIPLAPPARSVYDAAPEALRNLLQDFAGRVGGGANWMVRKKTLCDLLLGLDAYFALPPEERDALVAKAGGVPAADGEDAVGDDGDGDGGDDVSFGELLPMYVGAVLERLAEPRIASVEQAALYLLSIHPEHHGAAERWIRADPRHAKAFRKIRRGDRRYDALATLAEKAARRAQAGRASA